MPKEFGIVRSKRGRKEKYGTRVYIIRYRVGATQKEIRFRENPDTDASFHSRDRITVETSPNLITVHNTTLGISVSGKPL